MYDFKFLNLVNKNKIWVNLKGLKEDKAGLTANVIKQNLIRELGFSIDRPDRMSALILINKVYL